MILMKTSIKSKVIFIILVVLFVATTGKLTLGLLSEVSHPEIKTVCNTDKIKGESYQVQNSDTVIDVIDKTIYRLLKREGLKGGASVAISKNGKLVYAKGIGFSSVEDSVPMLPGNILRVASVSKLITAVAVMKLVEKGSIGLHQKVFGPTGVLNNDKYLAYKDKRMGDVTVYQLLNHSGGWTARYGDPMFMPQSIARQMGKELPIKMEDIIRFMQTKSMHFKPGSASIYSNFGYGILGEIVAKASGMPYEDYVKSEVLAPLGIYDSQIGYSYLNERLDNEVVYYEADTSHVAFDYTGTGEMVRRAYGGTDIHTLGSAGGWVSSATDLLKLVLTIDGHQSIIDQLGKQTVDTMVNCQPGYDPLGWRRIIGDSWYRTGTLAATSAIIGRLDNDICYVVLLNCSNHRGPELATMLRLVMDAAIKNVENWPDNDMLSDDPEWMFRNLVN
ncbi:MAG: beta-lactamase family protein [Bacteroidales bacterium]|nr:beta-lactamase family protein [Bacteroidales bacterium]